MPYLLRENIFLKNAAWSRMSNFLKPQQKLKTFPSDGGITDLGDLK